MEAHMHPLRDATPLLLTFAILGVVLMIAPTLVEAYEAAEFADNPVFKLGSDYPPPVTQPSDQAAYGFPHMTIGPWVYFWVGLGMVLAPASWMLLTVKPFSKKTPGDKTVNINPAELESKPVAETAETAPQQGPEPSKALDSDARDSGAKNALEATTLIVSIMGFSAAIYTIHDAAKQFADNVYASATPWFLDLDKAFIDKPEYRQYFYWDNAQPVAKYTKPKERYDPRALAYAEYVLDVFDSYLATRTEYGHQSLPPDWANWMYHTFDSSPLLVRYLLDHKEWYQSGVLYKCIFVKWCDRNGGENGLYYRAIHDYPPTTQPS
jgi:hypothetical protein